MPVAVIYLFLWQWAQVFARVLQAMVDGESLATGLYGPNVARAYWYMLASIVVLAVAFRLVLGRLRGPTQQEWTAHREWRPLDLFTVYVGTLIMAVGCSYAGYVVPALDQPLDALSRIKVVVLFMLFTNVLSTGRGGNFMAAAVLLEIMIGFTGLLSDFRGVFVYLAIAALAARIAVSGTAIAGGIAWLSILVVLGLFWSAVKADYRQFATGSSESQNVSVPMSERLGYIGGKALSPGDIDWNLASYALLSRLAYVDIFGSVIGVQETAPELVSVGQWQDALGHVFRPRFLFPDKAALSDTEVYVRLARGDASEQVRARDVDQRGLHGGELRGFRVPRHAGRRVRAGRDDGLDHPLFHAIAIAVDAARGDRAGVRLRRGEWRCGGLAAQDIGRHADVLVGLRAAREVRLADRAALAEGTLGIPPAAALLTRSAAGARHCRACASNVHSTSSMRSRTRTGGRRSTAIRAG